MHCVLVVYVNILSITIRGGSYHNRLEKPVRTVGPTGFFVVIS